MDVLPDGSLAIIDYKTGKPPSGKQVAAGYSMQLGLLGLIAEQGEFEGLDGSGDVAAFEYWSLGRDYKADSFGYCQSPVDPKHGKSSGRERGSKLVESLVVGGTVKKKK